MATNILTTGGTPDEESAEFTVATGTPASLNLKGADNLARVVVLKKDDQNAFQPTSVELRAATPDGVLVGAGVYKAVRKAGTCGVFRD